MTLKKLFARLHNPAPDSGGTDTGTVDRGDLLEAETPEAKETESIKDDPAVKELEAELETAKDGGAEGDKPTKDSRIPQSRHKEILEKERAKTNAALAELAELKKRGELASTRTAASADFAAIEAEVAALEEEYATLLTDGEIKKATEVMRKIRSSERLMAESKADLKIQAATAQAQESSRYQTALSRIEAAFPILNPDHDDYDEKAEARISRLARANQADGMTPTAALQDAVETIIGAATTAQERATTVTPRAEKSVGAERKADAVDKTLKAVAKTPPSLSRVGTDSDKLGGKITAEAAVKLSQKAFAALSDADLSELRGDSL